MISLSNNCYQYNSADLRERSSSSDFPLSSGMKASRGEREETYEPLRSLKPYILANWASLLDAWASEQSLPPNMLERSSLSAILDNVFRLLNRLGDDSDASEGGLIRVGNLSLSEAVNCRVHEPYCLELLESCVEAFESVIVVFHPLEVNGRNLDVSELEGVVEIAIRGAIHGEMDACERRCDGARCPFARDCLGELTGRMGR